MTLRTMYDSVDPSKIPGDAELVAGYIDGLYAWDPAAWGRFTGGKVRIAVFASTNDGHVIDVERGDATPTQAVGWVVRRRASGLVAPCVYCSAESDTYGWPEVRAAFDAAKVPPPLWWIAAYPGIGQQLYPDTLAHQYTDAGPYDLSVVGPYWPGVDPAPEDTMPQPVADHLIELTASLAATELYRRIIPSQPIDRAGHDYWAYRIATSGESLVATETAFRGAASFAGYALAA